VHPGDAGLNITLTLGPPVLSKGQPSRLSEKWGLSMSPFARAFAIGLAWAAGAMHGTVGPQ